MKSSLIFRVLSTISCFAGNFFFIPFFIRIFSFVFLFSHAVPEGPERFSDPSVFAVTVYDRLHIRKMKSPLRIHIRRVHMDGHDLADEQRVRSQRKLLLHPALDRYRRFADHRTVNMCCRDRRQMRGLEFVLIFPAFHAAVIHRVRHLLRRHIYDEHVCLRDERISLPGGSQGNADHRRIRADRPCPGHGTDIDPAVPAP